MVCSESTALVAHPVHALQRNVSVRVILWPIENSVLLVELLLVTMKFYEESKAPGTDAHRSSVYWFTGTGEMKAEKSWKGLYYASMREMEENIIHEAMFDILKPLNGIGGEIFEESKAGQDLGKFVSQ